MPTRHPQNPRWTGERKQAGGSQAARTQRKADAHRVHAATAALTEKRAAAERPCAGSVTTRSVDDVEEEADDPAHHQRPRTSSGSEAGRRGSQCTSDSSDCLCRRQPTRQHTLSTNAHVDGGAVTPFTSSSSTVGSSRYDSESWEEDSSGSWSDSGGWTTELYGSYSSSASFITTGEDTGTETRSSRCSSSTDVRSRPDDKDNDAENWTPTSSVSVHKPPRGQPRRLRGTREERIDTARAQRVMDVGVRRASHDDCRGAVSRDGGRRVCTRVRVTRERRHGGSVREVGVGTRWFGPRLFGRVPYELFIVVCEYLPVVDYLTLLEVSRDYFQAITSADGWLWRDACLRQWQHRQGFARFVDDFQRLEQTAKCEALSVMGLQQRMIRHEFVCEAEGTSRLVSTAAHTHDRQSQSASAAVASAQSVHAPPVSVQEKPPHLPVPHGGHPHLGVTSAANGNLCGGDSAVVAGPGLVTSTDARHAGCPQPRDGAGSSRNDRDASLPLDSSHSGSSECRNVSHPRGGGGVRRYLGHVNSLAAELGDEPDASQANGARGLVPGMTTAPPANPDQVPPSLACAHGNNSSAPADRVICFEGDGDDGYHEDDEASDRAEFGDGSGHTSHGASSDSARGDDHHQHHRRRHHHDRYWPAHGSSGYDNSESVLRAGSAGGHDEANVPLPKSSSKERHRRSHEHRHDKGGDRDDQSSRYREDGPGGDVDALLRVLLDPAQHALHASHHHHHVSHRKRGRRQHRRRSKRPKPRKHTNKRKHPHQHSKRNAKMARRRRRHRGGQSTVTASSTGGTEDAQGSPNKAQTKKKKKPRRQNAHVQIRKVSKSARRRRRHRHSRQSRADASVNPVDRTREGRYSSDGVAAPTLTSSHSSSSNSSHSNRRGRGTARGATGAATRTGRYDRRAGTSHSAVDEDAAALSPTATYQAIKSSVPMTGARQLAPLPMASLASAAGASGDGTAAGQVRLGHAADSRATARAGAGGADTTTAATARHLTAFHGEATSATGVAPRRGVSPSHPQQRPCHLHGCPHAAGDVTPSQSPAQAPASGEVANDASSSRPGVHRVTTTATGSPAASAAAAPTLYWWQMSPEERQRQLRRLQKQEEEEAARARPPPRGRRGQRRQPSQRGNAGEESVGAQACTCGAQGLVSGVDPIHRGDGSRQTAFVGASLSSTSGHGGGVSSPAFPSSHTRARTHAEEEELAQWDAFDEEVFRLRERVSAAEDRWQPAAQSPSPQPTQTRRGDTCPECGMVHDRGEGSDGLADDDANRSSSSSGGRRSPASGSEGVGAAPVLPMEPATPTRRVRFQGDVDDTVAAPLVVPLTSATIEDLQRVLAHDKHEAASSLEGASGGRAVRAGRRVRGDNGGGGGSRGGQGCGPAAASTARSGAVKPASSGKARSTAARFRRRRGREEGGRPRSASHKAQPKLAPTVPVVAQDTAAHQSRGHKRLTRRPPPPLSNPYRELEEAMRIARAKSQLIHALQKSHCRPAFPAQPTLRAVSSEPRREGAAALTTTAPGVVAVAEERDHSAVPAPPRSEPGATTTAAARPPPVAPLRLPREASTLSLSALASPITTTASAASTPTPVMYTASTLAHAGASDPSGADEVEDVLEPVSWKFAYYMSRREARRARLTVQDLVEGTWYACFRGTGQVHPVVFSVNKTLQVQPPLSVGALPSSVAQASGAGEATQTVSSSPAPVLQPLPQPSPSPPRSMPPLNYHLLQGGAQMVVHSFPLLQVKRRTREPGGGGEGDAATATVTAAAAATRAPVARGAAARPPADAAALAAFASEPQRTLRRLHAQDETSVGGVAASPSPPPPEAGGQAVVDGSAAPSSVTGTPTASGGYDPDDDWGWTMQNQFVVIFSADVQAPFYVRHLHRLVGSGEFPGGGMS